MSKAVETIACSVCGKAIPYHAIDVTAIHRACDTTITLCQSCAVMTKSTSKYRRPMRTFYCPNCV